MARCWQEAVGRTVGRGNSRSTDLEKARRVGGLGRAGNLEVDPVVESLKCQPSRPRAWDLTLRARGSRWRQTVRESVTCLRDLAPPGGLGRLHLLSGSGPGTTEHPDFKAPQKSPNFNLLFQRAGNRRRSKASVKLSFSPRH